VIPGPKQAEEYDARSKSAEGRAARQKRMDDYGAENLKRSTEIIQKRANKVPQDIVSVNGVVYPQPKPSGIDVKHDPSATANMKTTTDPQSCTYNAHYLALNTRD
jgi:hypothetical protein